MGIHKLNMEQSCDNAPANTPSLGILIRYDTTTPTHPLSEVTDERHLWSMFSDPLHCTLSCMQPQHCNMNCFRTPYGALIYIDVQQLFHDGIYSLRTPLLYVALTFHS